MQTVSVGGVRLQLETAEAGTRYHAPILIIPGLFQSLACWQGMTSMLAHRGWDVYLLPRPAESSAHGWGGNFDDATTAAAGLAGNSDKLILVGADVGAALALAVSARVASLALGLFAPAEPELVAAAYERRLGILGRRRARKAIGPVAAPGSIAATSHDAKLVGAEPRALIRDLRDGVGFERPARHPPAIVFACDNDPLVDAERSLAFADSVYARAAGTRLNGRFWPALGWERACDDFHRFLILTLSDRVVEFPDEIIAD